ncbi:MAG: hypothetical protein AVDCRST_MAG37-1630 [uncultured Rubrobacteraceae bacterium]|uniref:Uncharacterized protein n=1 Tax=uncultured Rubrobacteraceae bacterium TaxID=349277 RepID=A0A6J4QH05_9ACTN|nr:MAG: hypothetical protein AVDCRST_MAG37-1630 [uncultured Rubrobacteraceae bacterium]
MHETPLKVGIGYTGTDHVETRWSYTGALALRKGSEVAE